MQKSQTTDDTSNYKWEINVGDQKFELSEKGYQQLMEKEKEGVRLVKVGDKLINPAFISSAKKIYREEIKPASQFLDWSTMNQKPVTDEKSLINRDKIKNDIRKMLKEKNREWKPVYKDPIHETAVSDIWEHLKSFITSLEFPIIDENWKDDPSISHHNEGRERHPVAYKTKNIDLGDSYDIYFRAEANFIWCDACKKHIRKQIVIFNDYESDTIARNL